MPFLSSYIDTIIVNVVPSIFHKFRNGASNRWWCIESPNRQISSRISWYIDAHDALLHECLENRAAGPSVGELSRPIGIGKGMGIGNEKDSSSCTSLRFSLIFEISMHMEHHLRDLGHCVGLVVALIRGKICLGLDCRRDLDCSLLSRKNQTVCGVRNPMASE